ncbi:MULTISPECIES: dethiobiotin synthase [Arthrobacter]|uniref:ATP-dependent dethiobiotin synthetase BioD n=1 Tax=Arthrobacter terricola TaxID=2547396 RepID=A0A4R5K5C2_9MICC|nr:MULTISPECIES: dethiobiotin synthase [Arthrobacter]MBT8163766.1 dethiobiotin synthase [Arthrobacter sp. GN70]TDF87035.1 dethiobiotin synthase [Arthrobacter terricola]
MTLPRIILITGTDTGVGKTVTTAALAAVLQQQGRSVTVYKPCQTGHSLGDSDVAEVIRLVGPLTAETGVVLGEPLAPVPAAAVDRVVLPPLAAHAERILDLASEHDHVLVEGAGGLLVELDHDGGTLAALGAVLGNQAGFVVVARPSLGTLNHTALTLEALERRGLHVAGVVLGGWPDTPGLVEQSNRATLASWPAPFLGALQDGAAQLDPAVFRERACLWLEEVRA